MTGESSVGSVRWVAIGRPETLRFNPGATVTVERQEIAIFPLAASASGYCALANSCPHAGASLAEGHLHGGELSCGWHGWRFDLQTGVCKTIAEDSARSYPVRLNEGVLEIGV